MVPALWPFEVANVLASAVRRGRIAKEVRNEFLAQLDELFIRSSSATRKTRWATGWRGCKRRPWWPRRAPSAAPKQILYRMVTRYRRKLQEALPDTVDLLGIVLGTGLGLDQAMMRVSEEMMYIYPELANEFATVVMQVRAGQERGKAFSQFVRRTGIEDIKALAAMIIQSEKFGTSLAQALKVYADALRTRRRLRADAAIGKAGIKMLFPIVIFILPVLFVITLVPGMLSVMRDLKLLGGGR
ncbi:MAG TPA: type II secretion system F family protein [Candidatus Acidoferrales bacterium]|nr:type II secretion system F family protein [Candidatus Acidoferrales bacterium]